MAMNKHLSVLMLALLMSMPLVAANPIGDFFDGLLSPVTSAFDAVTKFLQKLEIIGLNILEVLLFVIFLFLLAALFIIPARVYEYAKDSAKPFKAFFNWVRK